MCYPIFTMLKLNPHETHNQTKGEHNNLHNTKKGPQFAQSYEVVRYHLSEAHHLSEEHYFERWPSCEFN
jgi:hypothetical protein